jgi:multiple antibiotic resistance protein
MSWPEFLQTLTALFVIVNPGGSIPVFLGVTVTHSQSDRAAVARVAAVTVAAVLVTSVLCGERLLHLFGIDVTHFQVGGGIMLLLMAVSMLHAEPSRVRETPEEIGEAAGRETVGAVPLGTPILAGPGSISTAIIMAHGTPSARGRLLLLVACLLVAVSTWLALKMAEPIRSALGRTGINVLTRFEGLLLAALAVKFITKGLSVLLPGLASPA